MIQGFDCTDKAPPNASYEAVTYAYDLLNTEQKGLMVKELKRLRGKGETVVVYYFDTRKFPDHVQLEAEKWTQKPSVFAEIWREKQCL